ncbi:bifunctional lytic transglycosylase/C40 family peptidase [Paraliobacillus ryukyuensis]|uniref:bifunctional lytic transglycosylase/C40 family peptidase n=1 Tax=Paraliobacillus ryukyuensis TaxID=200904 RepID=UPI0009A88101|nr:bifunctional lytic transglycosylase/C40 family peptidase [Paraliobacillus ryukyuensis]
MGLTTVTVAATASKHSKKIVIIVLSFFLFVILIFAVLLGGSQDSENTKLSESVLMWRPVVTEFAEKYGIPDYVEVILAIIQVETGGNRLDIMQSSESMGLPPNTIDDPIKSIDVGVKHLAGVVKDAKANDLDYWTPIQSYNFGGGFNDYVETNGNQYTFELATAFSMEKANGRKVMYSNPIAEFNNYFRYAYGNMYYVMLIQQYLSPGAGGDIGNVDASPLGPDIYQGLMNEVLKYNGWPYQWGGESPSTSFDCSGLIQYAFRQLDYSVPRTAAQQYDYTIRVSQPKPGDLVFFKGTNSSRSSSAITHVGIYIDENRMYNAASSGIGYDNWNTGYWGQHFAGFGRVVK